MSCFYIYVYSKEDEEAREVPLGGFPCPPPILRKEKEEGVIGEEGKRERVCVCERERERERDR